MSNQAHILRTIFQTLDASGSIADETYGVRVFDDYTSFHVDLIESLEDLVGMSPDDILAFAWEYDCAGPHLLRYALEDNLPIWIDKRPYLVRRSNQGFLTTPDDRS